MGHPTDNDIAMPTRFALTEVLDKLKVRAPLTDQDQEELIEGIAWALKAISPEVDFLNITTKNPLHQVFFRAGLLACREYMARFVEQGGDAATAQSIRANWWPVLGDDPGTPRLFDFDEVATEIEMPDGGVRFESKPISPSLEALPRAFQFLQGLEAA
jgi:hypothetical protein